MFSVWRFDCFPLSKGDDTFWFGSKTVGMEMSPYGLFGLQEFLSCSVDVRTYLLGGAIDSSEENGIIRDPELELESSRFIFDLVPLSYESVDVVCLRFVEKRTKGDTRSRRSTKEDELRLCDIFVVLQGAMPICEGSCRLTSLERQEVWNDCRSCKVRVGSNGNLLREASVLLGRKKGGYGAKRKLSRCRRNQIGKEPILALLEGEDDFVVYYDARSKDLEACLEKGEESGSYWLDKVRTSIWRDVRTLAIEEAYTTKYSIHPGADTMLCGFRLTNRWLSMKKDIASCGSKYLASSEVEVEYQWSSGLLLQPELPE
ncbi:hypothetical protein Tco_0796483 [Tanacetum coccineum]